MNELKHLRTLAIGVIAVGVLLVCQNASATSFITNPAWVGPTDTTGVKVDSMNVQYPTGNFDVFGYEFTLNQNAKVNALGTYVGTGSMVNPLNAENVGTTAHPINNPGNAETLALYQATFATNGKINGWTLVPGTETTVSAATGKLDDGFDWVTIPQTSLSNATFACGTTRAPKTCKTTYEVVLFTNGNFVYETIVNGDQPDVLWSSVTMLPNGKTSSQGAKDLQLASYEAHHPAGIEGTGLVPSTDADFYGPSLGFSPEPSSLFLLGSGLLGLAGLVRRKLRRG
jgi:hypothetical protein